MPMTVPESIPWPLLLAADLAIRREQKGGLHPIKRLCSNRARVPSLLENPAPTIDRHFCAGRT